MTKIQAKQMRVVVARLGGAMTGVTIGCVAGSFPLLFRENLFVCMYVFMYRYLKIYFC